MSNVTTRGDVNPQNHSPKFLQRHLRKETSQTSLQISPNIANKYDPGVKNPEVARFVFLNSALHIAVENVIEHLTALLNFITSICIAKPAQGIPFAVVT